MSAPSRSGLPADLVAFLEKTDLERSRRYGRAPILPATSTPDELVVAAGELNDAIARHLAEGSDAARFVDDAFRPHIERVLRREQVETVAEVRTHRGLYDTDIVEKRRDLESAMVYFEMLLGGTDNSTEAKMTRFYNDTIRRRRVMAERCGVELDLTDEEWWQL